MTERRQVREVVFSCEYNCLLDEPPSNLRRFIEWAHATLEKVPVEYRDSAEINFQSAGDGCGASWVDIDVSFARPETEQEAQARKVRDKLRREEEIARLTSRIERLKSD